MSDVATKADLLNLREHVAREFDRTARELSEHRRQLKDNDEAHAAERLESEQRWQRATTKATNRLRGWAIAMPVVGVVLVAIIQVVSNHSFAAAREQMREVNRQDRVAAEPAQAAHDELLIKKTLDERDRRIDQLIIQAKNR